MLEKEGATNDFGSLTEQRSAGSLSETAAATFPVPERSRTLHLRQFGGMAFIRID